MLFIFLQKVYPYIDIAIELQAMLQQNKRRPPLFLKQLKLNWIYHCVVVRLNFCDFLVCI